ncbi:MAG: protocatechuate 3,4-dioxygenase subunit alpha [Pseudomonadota bacterium]
MAYDPARTTAPAATNLPEPIKETPSQTAGPFIHVGIMCATAGITPPFGTDLTTNRDLPAGEKITIEGRILDGEGAVATEAVIESWQADRAGSFARGIWRRAASDLETGIFRIETVKPGTAPDTGLAPHIALWIVARGLNNGLLTQLYFAEDDLTSDPILALVPEARRPTLIASGRDGTYCFDVHLQGPHETVFFDT